jgi:hypothetical protein
MHSPGIRSIPVPRITRARFIYPEKLDSRSTTNHGREQVGVLRASTRLGRTGHMRARIPRPSSAPGRQRYSPTTAVAPGAKDGYELELHSSLSISSYCGRRQAASPELRGAGEAAGHAGVWLAQRFLGIIAAFGVPSGSDAILGPNRDTATTKR